MIEPINLLFSTVLEPLNQTARYSVRRKISEHNCRIEVHVVYLISSPVLVNVLDATGTEAWVK